MASSRTTSPPPPLSSSSSSSYCNVCRRKVPVVDGAWQQHVDGRRHQRQLYEFASTTRVAAAPAAVSDVERALAASLRDADAAARQEDMQVRYLLDVTGREVERTKMSSDNDDNDDDNDDEWLRCESRTETDDDDDDEEEKDNDDNETSSF